ncbi:hypothetical protein [Mameliella sediminis]|uniref:hypothetical protein n=1 Tax=Mameliella sediminis TaxID=2836866 RepID=UPI001C43845F|nr:hypothetical protein [Mameliella sediminis]MBY6117289.1 hypothetical protein [Antarctobacter heliothermus]MBY6147167.1 hypothetical protein [Mameliella alba]MBV7397364.1 hypothetical protein [Mameliella sediminis]MBY6172534.1 hypothetical protein [Mameliella alba]MCA0957196.1 hypothetical protein [Mameliella alba]
MTKPSLPTRGLAAAGFGACMMLAQAASADQVFNDDVIITFSLCVGNDCVNGESFGFDTIRLKENNLRIKFQDTSNSASFPTVDWTIVANDSSNGGLDYLGFEDGSTGRFPFRVEAGAPANSLYVEADGDLGVKTANPVVDIHVVEGNTPTLRLEQDGSNGFTPQTYDIAANEANFFIRDVTNGSKLFFRAKPGAPEDSIFIAADGDLGIGTDAPTAALHVRRTDGNAALKIEEVNGTAAARGLLSLVNNGRVFFSLEDTSIIGTNNTGRIWNLQNDEGQFTITTAPGTDGKELILSQNGNLTITGDFISGTTTLTVPDYVFQDGYDLRPLSEVRAHIDAKSHLPDVPSAAEIARSGLNMGQMQMTLLRKIEELMLYTLQQEDKIAVLNAELATLKQLLPD